MHSPADIPCGLDSGRPPQIGHRKVHSDSPVQIPASSGGIFADPGTTKKTGLLIIKRLCIRHRNIQFCGRPGIDPEIPGQFDDGTMYADAEEFCGEVDDITGFPASETVVPLVQLQTGVVIVVEGVKCHPMLVWLRPLP